MIMIRRVNCQLRFNCTSQFEMEKTLYNRFSDIPALMPPTVTAYELCKLHSSLFNPLIESIHAHGSHGSDQLKTLVIAQKKSKKTTTNQCDLPCRRRLSRSLHGSINSIEYPTKSTIVNQVSSTLKKLLYLININMLTYAQTVLLLLLVIIPGSLLYFQVKYAKLYIFLIYVFLVPSFVQSGAHQIKFTNGKRMLMANCI